MSPKDAFVGQMALDLGFTELGLSHFTAKWNESLDRKPDSGHFYSL